MTVALVPVKRLANTKSRLFEQLSEGPSARLSASEGDEAREAFTLAMLQDVIAALGGAESVDRTIVLTPDEDVAVAARTAGAEALVRDDPGLNSSLDLGARALALGNEALLVMLGDVAGALPSDIDALCQALAEQDGRGVVLAPSSDGGTSALLRAPFDAVPPCFGPDSAKRHREAATERGVTYRELPLPSLALDLDVPADITLFLRSEHGGRATRQVLHRLGFRGPA